MDKPAILFFEEGIPFRLKNRRKIRTWIRMVVESEQKECGNVNYIFCSDNYLLDLNRTYLRHDTFTDIITFDYSENRSLAGDIFISIDRVRENAKQFGVPVVLELYRVMVHGILHLAGYKDNTSTHKAVMRAKEDYYLSLLPGFTV